VRALFIALAAGTFGACRSSKVRRVDVPAARTFPARRRELYGRSGTDVSLFTQPIRERA